MRLTSGCGVRGADGPPYVGGPQKDLNRTKRLSETHPSDGPMDINTKFLYQTSGRHNPTIENDQIRNASWLTISPTLLTW